MAKPKPDKSPKTSGKEVKLPKDNGGGSEKLPKR